MDKYSYEAYMARKELKPLIDELINRQFEEYLSHYVNEWLEQGYEELIRFLNQHMDKLVEASLGRVLSTTRAGDNIRTMFEEQAISVIKEEFQKYFSRGSGNMKWDIKF